MIRCGLGGHIAGEWSFADEKYLRKACEMRLTVVIKGAFSAVKVMLVRTYPDTATDAYFGFKLFKKKGIKRTKSENAIERSHIRTVSTISDSEMLWHFSQGRLFSQLTNN